MTAAQEARLIGFRASIAERGISLTFGDQEFLAIVQPVVGENLEHLVGEAAPASENKLHILRDDLVGVEIVIGESFTGPSGETYRVAHIENNPAKPAVVFTCPVNP